MAGRIKSIWNDRSSRASALLMLASVGLLVAFAARPTVRNTGDLVTIHGTLTDHSFYDGWRRSHSYYVWLAEYPARFQIGADSVPVFAKAKFESEAFPGDLLTISIPSEFRAKLTSSSSNVLAFGISDPNAVYLDADSAVANYNNPLGSIMAVAMGLLGAILFIVRQSHLNVTANAHSSLSPLDEDC